MTANDLKNALIGNEGVEYCGGIYKLTGIVYRAEKGHIKVSAELLDKNGNCIIYAMPNQIHKMSNGSK